MAGITVNGASFTVNLYRGNSSTPSCKQSINCSKNITTGATTCTPSICSTSTPTPSPIQIATPTPSKTPTPTPIKSPTPTPTGPATRPLKYYVVDRVCQMKSGSQLTACMNTDYPQLAAWGINTVILDLWVGPKGGQTIAQWDNIVNTAIAAGLNVVIWPDGHQMSDVSSCRWETPFDDGSTGGSSDKIVNIKPILDHFATNPHIIGIVTAHEPTSVASSSQDGCSATVADMTTIKTQIKDYMSAKGRSDFKVWNYINHIDSISRLTDYSATNIKAQVQGIMDVAVIWNHCAGYPTYNGDNSHACDDTNKGGALGGVNYDRNTMIKANSLEGLVDEVFIIQTFDVATVVNGVLSPDPDYGGIFTTDELQTYSCKLLNTNSLDGFGYYTWDGGWYHGELKTYYTANPTGYNTTLTNIYNTCINKTDANPTPTPVLKPGDTNNDNIIDGRDYVIWLNHFGQAVLGITNGDFDKNNVVDGRDYVIWLNNYGK
jgi:hypothetical protein